jgi:hypothetical protein
LMPFIMSTMKAAHISILDNLASKFWENKLSFLWVVWFFRVFFFSSAMLWVKTRIVFLGGLLRRVDSLYIRSNLIIFLCNGGEYVCQMLRCYQFPSIHPWCRTTAFLPEGVFHRCLTCKQHFTHYTMQN